MATRLDVCPDQRRKRALVTLASQPPAKRLKQACLPFKVVSSVERSVSSQAQKRELSNYVETVPIVAKVELKSTEDFTVVDLTESGESDVSHKENRFPCVESSVALEVDKNQRPISYYLSPSKRTIVAAKETDQVPTDPIRNVCRDLSVVIQRVDQDKCEQWLMEADDIKEVTVEDQASQIPAETSFDAGAAAKQNVTSIEHRDDEANVSTADASLVESSLNTSLIQTDCSVERGESTGAKVNTLVNVSTHSAADCTVKRIKKLKKVKQDPAKELEKAKLKEERKKAQEEKDKLKMELCRLKTERMEQKLKDKEEKQRLMDEEKRKKQEALDEKERKKKEKLSIEDEKKEEKRRLEEEEKRKNQKAKTAFANFFVKKQPAEVVWQKPKNLGTFLPFQVKENMRLAPTHRNNSCNTSELTQKLDSVLSFQSEGRELYLKEFKMQKMAPRTSSRTWPVSEKDVEIMECTDNVKTRKAKLLQFVENVRPPYWGTWGKRSAVISPRNPLKRDERIVDYELDSDEEWADEEPGESLSHSEGEKESEDDYEVDNDFFVPHGYLSDEEVNDDDKETVSADTFKAQLKIKEQEFQKDRKKKCMQIKPIVFGCIWADSDQSELKKVLEEYAAVAVGSFPIETRISMSNASCESMKKTSPNTSTTPRCQISDTSKNSSSSALKYAKELPNEAMPYLVRLVHGNQHSSKLICHEFQEFWQRHLEEKFNAIDTKFNAADEKLNATAQIASDKVDLSRLSSQPDASFSASVSPQSLSKTLLQSTIRKIATWRKFPDKGPLSNILAWYVTSEKRQECGLDALTVPNNWEYCTRMVKKSASVARCNNGPRGIDSFSKSVTLADAPGGATAPTAPQCLLIEDDDVMIIDIIPATTA